MSGAETDTPENWWNFRGWTHTTSQPEGQCL